MKQLEDLARLRVNDAIRNGIRSQHIHRILSENGANSTRAAGVEVADPVYANYVRKLFVFPVLRTILLKIIGFLVVR